MSGGDESFIDACYSKESHDVKPHQQGVINMKEAALLCDL